MQSSVIIEKMKSIKDKIKGESERIKKEIRQKTIGYILTAFGLVAGLAWNEAIKGLIEYFFPLNKNTILAKFIYAIIITLVVVIVSVYVMRLLGGNKEGKK